jgi:hypothetical protein
LEQLFCEFGMPTRPERFELPTAWFVDTPLSLCIGMIMRIIPAF